MTTVICFDLDGTLVHFPEPYETVVRETLTAHGIEYTDEIRAMSEDAFRTAFDALEPEPYRQSMAAIVEAAESDADPDTLVETLRENEYAATTVPDAARDSLTALAADNTLAVITNGVRDWQVGKLDHHGLTDLFDLVVASYEVGAHKPDSAPFDRVRDELPADEYVMVGDEYESDVEGARAAGFVPIHYEPGDDDRPDLWDSIDALL
ncbi:noncanonical pyrimidine nucleotidase, YjjG family protein [Haloarcula mannanilytica]|uniref:Noncanonical pyrimidine nucleotidase, YjjG family protein n=1 Tax=Haloarcula mannanilytica TaxID=2509225 RepID=A0A4C2EL64_9EURY|nr:HAD family hydrolase [Haloarcula mannanilytica]GCF13353.1 noncanonical pyrimidine nucleotidase, YjjG family protein [Haloarcula mannanilytica]